MDKICKRCGDKLNPVRTNQHYCTHCADITEYERRDERLKALPKRKRALLKATKE